ncbi:MAG: hypothetical protein M3464_07125 [Chloroflexota bacterium]|nr:hypothetical protein [Chloroflexota bacterium]
MRFSWHRLAGAVAFACLFTLLVFFSPSGEVSATQLLWALSSGIIIGYIAFPGLAYAWSARPPWRPPWGRVAATAGLAGSAAIGVTAVSARLSDNDLRPVSLLVSFLFAASLIYINLGRRDSRSPSLRRRKLKTSG